MTSYKTNILYVKEIKQSQEETPSYQFFIGNTVITNPLTIHEMLAGKRKDLSKKFNLENFVGNHISLGEGIDLPSIYDSSILESLAHRIQDVVDLHNRQIKNDYIEKMKIDLKKRQETVEERLRKSDESMRKKKSFDPLKVFNYNPNTKFLK